MYDNYLLYYLEFKFYCNSSDGGFCKRAIRTYDYRKIDDWFRNPKLAKFFGNLLRREAKLKNNDEDIFIAHRDERYVGMVAFKVFAPYNPTRLLEFNYMYEDFYLVQKGNSFDIQVGENQRESRKGNPRVVRLRLDSHRRFEPGIEQEEGHIAYIINNYQKIEDEQSDEKTPAQFKANEAVVRRSLKPFPPKVSPQKRQQRKPASPKRQGSPRRQGSHKSQKSHKRQSSHKNSKSQQTQSSQRSGQSQRSQHSRMRKQSPEKMKMREQSQKSPTTRNIQQEFVFMQTPHAEQRRPQRHRPVQRKVQSKASKESYWNNFWRRFSAKGRRSE